MTIITDDDAYECGRGNIGPTTALQALEKGLDDLMQLCDVVMDKFIVAKEEYDAANPHPPPPVTAGVTDVAPST